MGVSSVLQFVVLQQHSLAYTNDAQRKVVLQLIESAIKDLLKPIKESVYIKTSIDMERLVLATTIYDQCNSIASQSLQAMDRATFNTFFSCHMQHILADTQRLLVDDIQAPTLREERRLLNKKIEDALAFCT